MKKLYAFLAAGALGTLMCAGVVHAALDVVQAEDMNRGAATVVPVTDNGATPARGSPKALRWAGVASASTSVDLVGTGNTIGVRNRSNGVGPYTQRLYVDGNLVDEREIGRSATSYALRPAAIRASPGQHKITVRVIEDITGTERHFVDRLEINYTPRSTDADGDGVDDSADNCPQVANPEQNPEEVITEDEDVAAIVNADPETRETDFCVHAGTYGLSARVDVGPEDHLLGEAGTLTEAGPAVRPSPVVRFTNPNGLTTLVRNGGGEVRWIWASGAVGGYQNIPPDAPCRPGRDAEGRCPQAGTGRNFSSPTGNPDSLFVRNKSTGAGSMGFNGGATYLENEASGNGTDHDFVGFTASGIKADEAHEAARNYIANNGGNGLWCDQGCAAVAGEENGWWIHDNLVVGNAKNGVRWEYAPLQGPDDPPSATVEALIEDNRIAGNDNAGVGIRDSQNATVRGNTFGPGAFAGETYGRNGNNAILASESGTRTRLFNIDIFSNTLLGDPPEDIEGYEHAQVDCSRQLGYTP